MVPILPASRPNRFAFGTLLLIAALSPAGAQPAGSPTFDAIRFFEGRTEGKGVLKVVLSSAEPIRVQSQGRILQDGTLLLVQEVTQGKKRPRTREWRLREVSPGRYEGTLTDAVGTVAAEADRNRLHIRFRMKGGLAVEQWLTLAPGGRSAENVMRVRKFGVTFATLNETIRKID